MKHHQQHNRFILLFFSVGAWLGVWLGVWLGDSEETGVVGVKTGGV